MNTYVKRVSSWKRGYGYVRFTEHSPSNHALAHECGCTHNVTVRPEGEPLGVSNSIEFTEDLAKYGFKYQAKVECSATAIDYKLEWVDPSFNNSWNPSFTVRYKTDSRIFDIGISHKGSGRCDYLRTLGGYGNNVDMEDYPHRSYGLNSQQVWDHKSVKPDDLWAHNFVSNKLGRIDLVEMFQECEETARWKRLFQNCAETSNQVERLMANNRPVEEVREIVEKDREFSTIQTDFIFLAKLAKEMEKTEIFRVASEMFRKEKAAEEKIYPQAQA